MPYFNTGKTFLFPSFDLDEKERDKIDRFLQLLDNSNIDSIIVQYINNLGSSGGRPNVNYFKLFATILYGFAFGYETLRSIEEACRFDLRFIYLMEQVRPSYTTICAFINKIIVPNEERIFSLINKQIAKEMNMSFTDAFIDGSKFEANANKYKFVWKPTTFHKRISMTINDIIKKNDLILNYTDEELIRSSTVAIALSNLEKRKENLDNKIYKNLSKTLLAILSKILEYEEKERICGPNRKSYYKTDHDATAMCLKEDYYSGLGSNMHAAYNTQILVIKGFVFSYYVSQSRADMNDFIPVIERFYRMYETFPKNICADAGYGSLINYRYLKNNGIGNFVKDQSWEGNLTGTRPNQYRYNNHKIVCLNGNTGYPIDLKNRHPKKSGSVFYKVNGCNSCLFMPYCKQYMTDISKDEKIFEVIEEFQMLKQEAEDNLLSRKGIEIRVNRSIQVEGVFGIAKQNHGYDRTRRRGLNNVSAENMLTLLGLNIKKLFRHYEGKLSDRFWVAPDDLEPQKFAKPSWKKLSKKGIKTNAKMKEGIERAKQKGDESTI